VGGIIMVGVCGKGAFLEGFLGCVE